MSKGFVSTSIFLFNCYLCLGTLHDATCLTLLLCGIILRDLGRRCVFHLSNHRVPR